MKLVALKKINPCGRESYGLKILFDADARWWDTEGKSKEAMENEFIKDANSDDEYINKYDCPIGAAVTGGQFIVGCSKAYHIEERILNKMG